MKLPEILVGVILCLGLVMAFFPSGVASALVVTTTITGVNAPNAQNFVNGFVPLFLPLAFAELFGFIMYELKAGGDFFVTLWFFGIALGCSFGTMVSQIPIGMTIIAWVILVLWWWAGGQGEGSGASGDANLRLPRGF